MSLSRSREHYVTLTGQVHTQFWCRCVCGSSEVWCWSRAAPLIVTGPRLKQKNALLQWMNRSTNNNKCACCFRFVHCWYSLLSSAKRLTQIQQSDVQRFQCDHEASLLPHSHGNVKLPITIWQTIRAAGRVGGKLGHTLPSCQVWMVWVSLCPESSWRLQRLTSRFLSPKPLKVWGHEPRPCQVMLNVMFTHTYTLCVCVCVCVCVRTYMHNMYISWWSHLSHQVLVPVSSVS